MSGAASWLLVAVLAVAAGSIVVSALRTGIAPMPSSRLACEAMVDAVRSAPEGLVVDLGSGWGQLAIRLATAFPQRRVVGYELSPLPWLVSTLAARVLRLTNLSFIRTDFRHVDLGPVAVLTCYLFRDGMRQLAGQLRKQSGSVLVVSNTFTLPGHPPSEVRRLPDFHGTRIYTYRFAREATASHG